MKTAHLFAGLGAFALASRQMGWAPVWFGETHPHANDLLQKNFPGVPNHGDVRLIDGSQVERPDILTSGSPCQDISGANPLKIGANGAKSGLWRQWTRLIDELRPRYTVFENVRVIYRRGLDDILLELAALGYDAEWSDLTACAMGHPHTRARLFLVAYPHGDGKPALTFDAEAPGVSPDAVRVWHGWAPKPRAVRMAHGLPRGVDRLSRLGNSMIPAEAELVYRAIARREAVSV